ncbi:MAG: N4-bis(aminopropyl)spermidine synthase [Cryptosporangiaceae bacterium]|nr:N4-bis(aminopropyl)spermidine synthase [Cryptosporangiaceae bacterium]
MAALIAGYGAYARPLREVLARLGEGVKTVSGLVAATGVPRRTVEEVLAALGDGDPAAYAGADQLRRTAVDDPLAARLAAATDLRRELSGLVERAPAGLRALDHVAATAETAAWRGLWLDATYDLAGARLLCVGDHDLTSLAATLANPALAVTVVDVDERILEYIGTEAACRGLDVTCLAGDLRYGLPPSAAECADLVFTDPPYTPEGVRLFLARGAEGLRDRERGRLLMAYGFSDRTPALGLKVQQAGQELALAYEAILPGVQHYDGAEAIGSASDLYVCRPTARTWKVLGAVAESAANIYTHGPQSLEAAAADTPGPDPVIEALGEPPTAVVGRWQVPGVSRVGLGRLLATGLPASATVRGRTAVVADLTADHGPLLLRVLLAANAQRVAVLLPPQHPDLAAHESLSALIAAKYRLRFVRRPGYAIAVGDAVPPGDSVASYVLTRAHGKVANVWRDALIRLDPSLTKNEARRIVAQAAPNLTGSAVELPRHRLAEILASSEVR